MPVTAVTPRSPWSLEVKHLTESLLRCATWRNAVANRQLEDAALYAALTAYQGDESLGRTDAAGQVVHYLLEEQAFPENPAVALPRASIRDHSMSVRRLGGLSYEQSGELCLDFEIGCPDVYAAQNSNDKYFNFVTYAKNLIGDVIRELLDFGDATAGCLCVKNIDVVACGICDEKYTNGALVFGADLLVSHGGP